MSESEYTEIQEEKPIPSAPESNSIKRQKGKSVMIPFPIEDLTIQYIVDQVIEGRSLTEIALNTGLSYSRVWETVSSDEDGRQAYIRASSLRAHKLADDINHISNQCLTKGPKYVNGARVAIQAKQWLASKLNPGTYGDRGIDVQATGNGVSFTISGLK